MDEFVKLMDEFWITREKSHDDYYRIKRILDTETRDFLHRFPDWRVIQNNKLIKLEKIPAEASPFMGITEFESPTDYCLLCAVLIYLDDMSEGEQFLLTELIESVERIVGNTVRINFTLYSDRKSLVRVLRFAQEKDLLRISEGSLDNAANDRNAEILYENTGYSVYFSVHHDNDISGITGYRDFENTDENDSHKASRVYRRLLLQPAMYWESQADPDSIYLKNFRSSVAKHLEKYIEGRLDIYNGAAFYLMAPERKYGEIFPSDKMISGIAALICGEIISSDIHQFTDIQKFYSFADKCRKKYGSGFSKEYREMPDEKFHTLILEYMKSWMFVREKDGLITVSDGAFLSRGKYPDDFKNKTEE